MLIRIKTQNAKIAAKHFYRNRLFSSDTSIQSLVYGRLLPNHTQLVAKTERASDMIIILQIMYHYPFIRQCPHTRNACSVEQLTCFQYISILHASWTCTMSYTTRLTGNQLPTCAPSRTQTAAIATIVLSDTTKTSTTAGARLRPRHVVYPQCGRGNIHC